MPSFKFGAFIRGKEVEVLLQILLYFCTVLSYAIWMQSAVALFMYLYTEQGPRVA
jgi:hypothetical protein